MENTTKHIGLTDAQFEHVTSFDPAILAEGQRFIEEEKAATQGQTLRTHWRGALFSLALSFALVMEGFDCIIGSFYGQPAFQRTFGKLQADGSYQISANDQSLIGNIGTIGNIGGLLVTGICQERFGSRKTYIGGMAWMIFVIFLIVFAKNIKMFAAANFLEQIGFGLFQTLTTAYAAEICPINLRGLLASFVNMAWGIGLVLSAGVGRASLDIDQTSNWAWRLPYCLQWVWPIPLAIFCYLAPESPWWLIRKGRFEEAEQSLRAAAAPGHYDGRDLSAYVTYMRHVDMMDRVEAKSGSFKECFTGTNRRRTEIMFGVWLIQVWGGQGITGLAVQFFEDSGLSVQGAFDVNLAINCMVILGCMITWALLPYFGRRPMYLFSLFATAACLLVIGTIAFTKITNGGRLAMAVLMILIQLLYSTSIGPLCYAISGELPNSRVRSQSIVLGRGLYCVCGFITGQLGPRFVNPTGWNLGAKSAYFWLGTNIVCTTWCYFRLPETGGFSFAELDILFANKVSTRKFKHVVIHDEVVESKPVAELEEKPTTAGEQVAHLE
ncbi:putative maltose permease [Kockovaella imperatae]|uniref:Putative maltose permease n=1 Tax=Kockovaella imperatae TaxID=4999 RepID=A0A1Y1UE04_9TREE|nr:putative maltose permease [Kockovaella imperatae]ORX36271.1 putative maltose permease [Kockovaella imperatae]